MVIEDQQETLEIQLEQVIEDSGTAKLMTDEILKVIDRLSDASGGLELTKLDTIVIPDDFTAEVIKFQKSHGELERGHTDREEASAVAKSMHYEQNGELRFVICYSKGMLGCLFSDDPKLAQLAAHCLHHELAHVEEGTRSYPALGINTPVMTDDLVVVLDYCSRVNWEEYYAERRSVGSFDVCLVEVNLDTLGALLEAVPARVYEQIMETKTSLIPDWYSLFASSLEEVSQLMKEIAREMGTIHGLEELWSIELPRPGKQLVDATDFHGLYEALEEDLSRLYETFPQWDGSRAFEYSRGTVLAFFATLGIKLTQPHDQPIRLDLV